MPADADSLAALGDLASGRHVVDAVDDQVSDQQVIDEQVTVAVPRARTAPARRLRLPSVLAAVPALRSPSSVPAFAALRALPRRIQLVGLAAGSVVAGLLAGLVLPVASAQPAPTTSARSIVVILPSSARPTPPAATPTSTTSARVSPPTAAAATHRAGSPAAVPPPTLATASAVDWSAASPAPARRAAAVAVTAAVARRAAEAAPARPTAATIAAATAYKPTRRLPATSGSGRRIVYSQHKGHVWVVGADGAVVRDYPVTGRIGRPKAGTYHVFSKSPTAVNPKAKVRFDLMVRFAHGITGAPIGFHTIPRWYDGQPIQRENQLGKMIGAGGCVRQSSADARWLYRWSRIGDTVVVLR